MKRTTVKQILPKLTMAFKKDTNPEACAKALDMPVAKLINWLVARKTYIDNNPESYNATVRNNIVVIFTVWNKYHAELFVNTTNEELLSLEQFLSADDA